MFRPDSTLPQVVVSADDFGISAAVNAGILEAHQRGIVRNTAVMVNYDAAEEAVSLLRAAPKLDVGIHLNLTSGPPVSDPKTVPSLTRRSGELWNLPTFLARTASGRIAWSEVRQECAAQVEKALRLGCELSSISSHQHVHMLPSMMRICADIARAYEIPFVRVTSFHRASLFRPLRPKGLCLYPFGTAARRILNARSVSHNHHVFDVFPLPRDRALARLRRIARRLTGGVYELIAHPGYVDAILRRRDVYTDQRLLELRILTEPAMGSVLREAGVHLTTYRSLAESERIPLKNGGAGAVPLSASAPSH